MEKVIHSQVAVITGGARGIGLAIAKRLAKAGCKVVIWDIDPSSFDTHAAGFEPAYFAKVNVAEHQSVETAYRDSVAAVGPIDILVNNAGINGPVANTWEYPLDAWDRVLAVDLTGVFYCCRAAIPSMKERKYGRIVNVASIAGKEGNPGIGAYAAAKAGVIGLTKSMAKELANDGVLVNAVAPVITETDLFKEMTPEHIERAKAKIPMGRFLTVDEIAAMVLWICSPECSFTTGFVFDLSGGRATY